MKIEEKVEELLRKHEKSKNDDRELQLAWMYYFCNLTESQKLAFNEIKDVIRQMPALETLSRARRKLQEINPYLRGSNYKARQSREKKLRDYYRNK